MREYIYNFFLKVANFSVNYSDLNEIIDAHLVNKPTLHPYGFYIWKISVPGLDGFSLRIHTWLPNIRPRQKPDWPPHSHNSDLHSFVLFGQVSNIIWDWKPCIDGSNTLYEVAYSADSSTLIKTGKRGDLQSERVGVILPFDDYLVPQHCFHASHVPNESPAVTLVLLSTETDGYPFVVGDHEGQERYEFDRQAVASNAAARARELASKCLFCLGSS